MLASYRIAAKTEELLNAPVPVFDEDRGRRHIAKAYVEGGVKYLYKLNRNSFQVSHIKDGHVRYYGPMCVSELRVMHPELYYKEIICM